MLRNSIAAVVCGEVQRICRMLCLVGWQEGRSSNAALARAEQCLCAHLEPESVLAVCEIHLMCHFTSLMNQPARELISRLSFSPKRGPGTSKTLLLWPVSDVCLTLPISYFYLTLAVARGATACNIPFLTRSCRGGVGDELCGRYLCCRCLKDVR